VDLVDLEPDARDTQVEAIVNDEARRPFNLAEGPIFRAQLVRLHLNTT